MEKLIIQFKLPAIQSLSIIEAITVLGFAATGNKFSVDFNGSKGYLSNIEILCEGHQTKRNNVIWIEKLRTRRGKLMSKKVKVFHGEQNGVRVEVAGMKQMDSNE